MTTQVAPQAPLLRRPLPPNKASPQKQNVHRRKPKSSKTKAKEDVLVIPDEITVSKQFDLLQRVRQREKEIQHCTKARGPEPFPHREPKKPVINHYLEFHGNAKLKQPPEFTLEDFIKNNADPPDENSAPHGTKTKMVSFHVWDDSRAAPGLSDVDKRVLSGTYVGNTDPLPEIPSRKPWPQQVVESKLFEDDASGDFLDQYIPEYIIKDGAVSALGRFAEQQYVDSHLHITGSPIGGSPCSPTEIHVRNEGRFLADMLSKFGTDIQDLPHADTPDAEVEGIRVHKKLSITLPCVSDVSANLNELGSQIVEMPNVDLNSEPVGEIKERGEDLSPTDLAIMNCLAHGGTKLDLKAHSLHSLKHISASLILTLTNVNLSFNDFVDIPLELFTATQLRSINMRNNPMSVIPAEISSWKSLKVLILSFCYIDHLHPSIFELEKLEILDLSYNDIEEVPRQIGKLKNLKELYVDGNQIGGFPRQILTLELRVLKCVNNFTHKLFWRSTAAPKPQNLGDIAATVFAQHQLHSVYANILTDEIREQLTSEQICDFCKSPVFGGGISVVKPAVEAFGIKFLPILFEVCSQTCRKHLRKATELDCV